MRNPARTAFQFKKVLTLLNGHQALPESISVTLGRHGLKVDDLHHSRKALEILCEIAIRTEDAQEAAGWGKRGRTKADPRLKRERRKLEAYLWP